MAMSAKKPLVEKKSSALGTNPSSAKKDVGMPKQMKKEELPVVVKTPDTYGLSQQILAMGVPEGYTNVDGQQLHTLWMNPQKGGRKQAGNPCRAPYDKMNDVQRKTFCTLLAFCFKTIDDLAGG